MLLCGHQAGLQRLKRNSASCPFLVRRLGGFRLAHEYSCRSKPLNLGVQAFEVGLLAQAGRLSLSGLLMSSYPADTHVAIAVEV